MIDSTLQLIDVALEAAATAAQDPLTLLQEGCVAVAMKKALLRAGCMLREGSPRTTEDWIISGPPESPMAMLVDRTSNGETKSDIRVAAPVALACELKVFGEIGSKDSFNRGDIRDASGRGKNQNSFLWDLEALDEGRADVVFLVCGARQYDTARGDRWDARGRDAGITLDDLLPPRGALCTDITSFERTCGSVNWQGRAMLVGAPALVEYAKNGEQRRRAEQRVVVALWKNDTQPKLAAA